MGQKRESPIFRRIFPVGLLREAGAARRRLCIATQAREMCVTQVSVLSDG